WITMQPQKGRFPKGHFGPEVSFARELKKAGYNPAIFKYTKGATGLARDWKLPGEAGIYDSMVKDLKVAINELEKKGIEVNPQAFIWIQGESDAGNEKTANNYYQNLKQLINDLQNNVLHKPNLKIILGVDEQHKFVEERPVILEVQQKLAKENSYIEFTSMVDLPKADATHLTPEGLVEHGNRLFDAFSKLVDDSGRNVSEPDTLRVITYNIWNGFDWGKDTLRRRKLQQWVNTQQPSVVALQELCAYTPKKLQEDAKSWGHAYSVLLKTTGIDFLVVHLHPGTIKRRRKEAEILIDNLKEKCIDAKVFNGEANWFLSDHYPVQAKFILN
ncbi:MAG: sialate O-acetylesterase, partial [Mariniphaga sp.]